MKNGTTGSEIMGRIRSLFSQVKKEKLCGSCRLYTGYAETGNVTGSCPMDGKYAEATRKACSQFKGGRSHEN